MSQESIVREYRNRIIMGLCIDLVPVKEEFFHDIVGLRNQEKTRHFLNQQFLLTIDMQREWYQKYMERSDDLYWCIRNKEGVVVGVIRLYDISSVSCTQGSFILYEKYSMGMPYALEAEILSLEFAFEKLGVNFIINEDRGDNKAMNSLTKKMGFQFEKEVEVRDEKFNRYILYKENCKLGKYKKILDEFMER